MEHVITSAYATCGYPTATMYTGRKTATMWAARCGAKDYAILATGRWKSNSKHFQTYVKAGCSDADRYTNKEEDPIRKIWVFHENVESVNAKPVQVTQNDAFPSHSDKKRKHEDMLEAEFEDDNPDDDDYDISSSQFLNDLGSPLAKKGNNSLEGLNSNMLDLIRVFKKEFVKANQRPDEARQIFERNMEKHGLRIPIDTHGLLANGGNAITSRPPHDDLAVYRHISRNVVVHAYGIQKHRLHYHPSWKEVDSVITLGLSEEADDIADILNRYDEVEEVKDESRSIPATSKEMCSLSFDSKQAIVDFFLLGNEKYKAAKDWLECINAKSKDGSMSRGDFRTYKQNYTSLCLQYIYSLKCDGYFLDLKKDRSTAATSWLKSNDMYNSASKSYIDIALSL